MKALEQYWSYLLCRTQAVSTFVDARLYPPTRILFRFKTQKSYFPFKNIFLFTLRVFLILFASLHVCVIVWKRIKLIFPFWSSVHTCPTITQNETFRTRWPLNSTTWCHCFRKFRFQVSTHTKTAFQKFRLWEAFLLRFRWLFSPDTCGREV